MSISLTLNPTLQTQFVFVGFNTTNYAQNLNSVLYDVDLINADLTIAFQTRVGERVMRPDWGCKIWEYFMNPMDEYNVNLIIQEAQRIISTDTRLIQQSIDVYENQNGNGLTVKLTLLYQPYNVIGTFLATFNSNNVAYFSGTTTN